MNPFKMLLLVIVSTGLACSAFAIEQTRGPGTTAPAVTKQGDANGASDALIAAAAAAELGVPAEAGLRHASVAAVQYAAADGNRIGARAAANSRGVTAPRMVEGSAAPAGSRSPAAAMPEPATWMKLLCGLVVAGFIARRRSSIVAG